MLKKPGNPLYRAIILLLFVSTLLAAPACFGQHLADINRVKSAKTTDAIDRRVLTFSQHQRDSSAKPDSTAKAKAGKSSAGDDSTLTLQGIGSFLTGLGVQTSATIEANGSFKNDKFYGDLEILKGSATADTLININADRLFIPEASNVLFQIKSCFGFSSWFGLNLNLSAGLKSVFQDTSQVGRKKTNSITMGQAGLIAEAALAQNELTVYGGITYTSPIVNRLAYQSYFGTDQSVDLWNLNFGLRGTIDRKFQIDVGVILLTNRSTNLFLGTSNDPLILAIKLSIPQDLLSSS